MKKILVWMLILGMVLSLAACGTSEGETEGTKSTKKHTTDASDKSSEQSTKEAGSKATDQSKDNTETEAPALPENMTTVRMKTHYEAIEYYTGNTHETVTNEATYSINEYGLYTSYVNVRTSASGVSEKKSQPGTFWTAAETGNTVTFSAKGKKPFRIQKDESGAIVRIEQGDNFETVFTYAAEGAPEGAVFQSLTKTEKTNYIYYYDAEYRMIKTENYVKGTVYTYTADDFCPLSGLLRSLYHGSKIQLKTYFESSKEGTKTNAFTCQIDYDEKGRILSHTHFDINGSVDFSQSFLQEGDEVPRDGAEYVIVDQDKMPLYTVSANQVNENCWTSSKTFYEDVPVVNDPLWLAFFMLFNLNYI